MANSAAFSSIVSFLSFSPNADQLAASKALEAFLADDASRVFVLSGYAGTGKTTMMLGLAKYAKSLGMPVELTAPTGTAAAKLKAKTGLDASTVHSAIYTHANTDINEDEGKTKTHFSVRSKGMADGSLLILDEASMVGIHSSQSEELVYGSGNLLADIFSFLGLHCNKRTKLVFVGDEAQLPPVGCDQSFALDIQYLQEQFGFKTLGARLTKVERHDNAILHEATRLREALEAGSTMVPRSSAGLGVFQVKGYDIANIYALMPLAKAKQNVVLFCANKSATRFNLQYRRGLFGAQGATILQPGEKLIIHNNSMAYALMNGDFVEVIAVGVAESRSLTVKTKYQAKPSPFVSDILVRSAVVTLRFRDVKVKTASGEVLDIKILEDFLGFEAASLPGCVRQALVIDLIMRTKNRMGASYSKKAAEDAMLTDKYYNAIAAKYGYAITVNKSQGGEWENVFFDSWTHKNMAIPAVLRFKYTAYTRAMKNLFTTG